MGQRTDMAIAAWQEMAGLEPVRGEQRKLIDEIQDEAYDLIKVLTLEASGIRDGDGYWHGCDVVGSSMNTMLELFQKYEAECEKEFEARKAARA